MRKFTGGVAVWHVTDVHTVGIYNLTCHPTYESVQLGNGELCLISVFAKKTWASSARCVGNNKHLYLVPVNT